MTRANDIASDHLRPDNGDLGRLLSGSTTTHTRSWAHTNTATTR